jgi:hypothetical protein
MGVDEGKGVIEAVAVGGIAVLVGIGESVTMNVEVGGTVQVGVAVLKLGTMVMPGVLVGTFGTQSN